MLLVVVAVAITLALVLQPKPNPNPPGPTTPGPTATAPPIEPTPPPTQDPLTELISSASSDGGVALADPSTSQNRALEWLAADPNLASYTNQTKIQRYALATLYFTTKGESWDNNDYWLSNKTVCDKWYQYDDTTIECTSNGGVSFLDLRDNNLQGSIPPEISMLFDSLGKFCIETNAVKLFHPVVNLGLCYSTEKLWLVDNELEGTIPTEIGELTKLSEYYCDWCKTVKVLILIILFPCWHSYFSTCQQ
jgi:hypothetical protein